MEIATKACRWRRKRIAQELVEVWGTHALFEPHLVKIVTGYLPTFFNTPLFSGKKETTLTRRSWLPCFLDNKCDPNVFNSEGLTPLMVAANEAPGSQGVCPFVEPTQGDGSVHDREAGQHAGDSPTAAPHPSTERTRRPKYGRKHPFAHGYSFSAETCGPGSLGRGGRIVFHRKRGWAHASRIGTPLPAGRLLPTPLASKIRRSHAYCEFEGSRSRGVEDACGVSEAFLYLLCQFLASSGFCAYGGQIPRKESFQPHRPKRIHPSRRRVQGQASGCCFGLADGRG